jgi:hypothetical protein
MTEGAVRSLLGGSCIDLNNNAVRRRQEAVQIAVSAMTKRKPPPQVFGGIRIVTTVWEPVRDTEQAVKEANANRLARAKFDQAMATSDPSIRYALLAQITDDGTAGAALLKYTRHVLKLKEIETKTIVAGNAQRQQKASEDRELYINTVKALFDEKPYLRRATRHKLAQSVQQRLKRRGKDVSIRTIMRALVHRK